MSTYSEGKGEIHEDTKKKQPNRTAKRKQS